jgi:hypothetical protein
MSDISLPPPPLPKPRLEQHELELWGQNVFVDLFDGQQMRAYVLLDRQQRASAEPLGYLWPTGMHPEFRYTQQKRDGIDGMPVYAAPPAPPDAAREAMRLALDALDTVAGAMPFPVAIAARDALRAALAGAAK